MRGHGRDSAGVRRGAGGAGAGEPGPSLEGREAARRPEQGEGGAVRLRAGPVHHPVCGAAFGGALPGLRLCLAHRAGARLLVSNDRLSDADALRGGEPDEDRQPYFGHAGRGGGIHSADVAVPHHAPVHRHHGGDDLLSVCLEGFDISPACPGTCPARRGSARSATQGC